MNKKKIAFTIIVAVIALSALCWVFWLVFYFDSTIDGSIVVDLTNEYILFERNYLVPLQIFGITIALTIFTFIFYLKLKKKKRKLKVQMILRMQRLVFRQVQQAISTVLMISVMIM